jgi:hypothetical protein
MRCTTEGSIFANQVFESRERAEGMAVALESVRTNTQTSRRRSAKGVERS